MLTGCGSSSASTGTAAPAEASKETMPPTAEVVEHNDTGWTIKAEIFGDGVDISLRGRDDVIEIIDGGK